ncbi:MAG TPA: DUF4394 domain-containing protein [Noviherbaspirillum sp.]|jgi:hypothetical protein|uniref:DUF4394 domain-containing protein n=1 Tax=Noviherbaspirillum sp. TaxID=1926288 RepID=UPI002F934585
MNTHLLSTLIVAASAATMLAAHATEDSGHKGAGKDDRSKAVASGASISSSPLQVIGLTSDQRLIEFRDSQPESARDIGSLQGLMSGDSLVGIDFRVQDGGLYGVTRTGGIYVIDQTTAQAKKVSQLTVALEGNSFGVDFNPAADRLRIVSDSGQNLRHNVNSGGATLVDDSLDYPAATALNNVGPTATGVSASAYTNNDLEATTATTLYNIDGNLDQLALQSPPNDGTLAAVGKLGTDAGAEVSFDIYSMVRDGAAVGIEGLASIASDTGMSTLYRVNLANGRLQPVGNFANQNKVIGIAIPLVQR